jgi:hypothetical protein
LTNSYTKAEIEALSARNFYALKGKFDGCSRAAHSTFMSLIQTKDAAVFSGKH